MSGYAASARIVRASPRLIRSVSADRPAESRPTEAGAVVLDGEQPREAPISFAERCGRFRDRWRQLTFYVTDPESWR